MSHYIFGDRIVLREAPAWHGISRLIFTDAMSASEAAEAAGWFEYEVVKLPVRVALPDHWGGLLSPDYDHNANVQSWVVVRSPTTDDPQPRIFASVSDIYTVLDNRDLARILDPLSEEWPVESAAVLKSGEHVFLTLKAGTTSVNGDELCEYFFVTADHTGKEGIRIGYSPVRFVCWNTLNAGVSAATEMVTISHSGDVLDKAEFHVELFQKLRAAREKTIEFFEVMGDTVLEDHQIEEVFESAWPHYPDSPSISLYRQIVANDGDAGLEDLLQRYPDQHKRLQREVARQNSLNRLADERRGAAWERLEYWNDYNPRMANTAWNVWAGAVTEVSDWRDGRDNPAESSIFGNRAAEKQRAFRTIVDLVGEPEPVFSQN